MSGRRTYPEKMRGRVSVRDDHIDALKAENKRLREALLTHQRVEWGENEHRFMCSICWTTSSQGHKKDCIFSELGVTHLPTLNATKLEGEL